MPGLAEGLEGVKAGEKREIRVVFPDRITGQGGDLEGKKAIFEVEAISVKVKNRASQAASCGVMKTQNTVSNVPQGCVSFVTIWLLWQKLVRDLRVRLILRQHDSDHKSHGPTRT